MTTPKQKAVHRRKQKKVKRPTRFSNVFKRFS